MKTSHIIIALFLFLIFGCEDDKPEKFITKEDIIGIWTSAINNLDTLQIKDYEIFRNDTIHSYFYHIYKYKLVNSQIYMFYDGMYEIYVPDTLKSPVTLSKDKKQLTIKGLPIYYPYYKGEEFYKITNK